MSPILDSAVGMMREFLADPDGYCRDLREKSDERNRAAGRPPGTSDPTSVHYQFGVIREIARLVCERMPS